MRSKLYQQLRIVERSESGGVSSELIIDCRTSDYSGRLAAVLKAVSGHHMSRLGAS